MSTTAHYALGSNAEEVARLDAQAASIGPATAMLLRAAGIAPGMRVLDLGTGLGHVATAVAEIVGPEGSVVAVDTSATLLAVADGRRRAAGLDRITYMEADARTYRAPEQFDAVVTRLLLFHLPDAVDVVRHHLVGLKQGGIFAAIDFDVGAVRAEPSFGLIQTVHGWVEAAFRHAGANPRIGPWLGTILQEAGCVEVSTFGVQAYLQPSDPRGPRLLGGVARSLMPEMLAAGIASAEEVGIETLQDRLAAGAEDAVILLPTVAGAWGRRED
jgi:ubiquinone/menaquinone biosynthesis C-methylase UbiE